MQDVNRFQPRTARLYVVAAVGFAIIVIAAVTIINRGALFGAQTVRHASPVFVTDISDPRKLVGINDNVFVGRVLKERRTFSRIDDDVWTLFEVEVVRTLKGELTGVVPVAQQGGSADRGRRVSTLEGDTLLEPGAVYLLTTANIPEGAFSVVTPIFGHVPIDGPEAMEQIVARYEDAVANEIPFDWDAFRRTDPAS